MIEIDNQTPFPIFNQIGAYWRPQQSFLSPRPLDFRLQVVVKATFSFHSDPAAPLAIVETQTPILCEDLERETGYLENDLAPMKEGVDLVILGEAQAPDARPVTSLDVSVLLGAWSRHLRVTGDRRFERGPRGELRPSQPAPFTRMPLEFERAFGGVHRLDDGSVLACEMNPLGRGYCPPGLDLDMAGLPLPNIESPTQPLTAPGERPEPAGCAVYRMGWSLRMQRALQDDDVKEPPQPLPSLWNCAHPDFILPAYPVGEVLRLQGMSHAGEIRVPLPIHPLRLAHRFDGGGEITAWPDLILVEPQRQRLTTVTRWLVACDEPEPSGTLGELRFGGACA